MRIAFIGCGNMGKAILQGILAAGLATEKEVSVSVSRPESAKKIESQYGVSASCDNAQAVCGADVVILAVKPAMFWTVLPEIRGSLRQDALILSVAAGQKLKAIGDLLYDAGSNTVPAIVRAMPNTPAMVSEGMSAMCANDAVTEEQRALAEKIFTSFGQAEWVPEKLMDAVTAVSGSAPAFVYLFIEALADQAVAEGMPRPQAYQFAAQTVMGSAKMVLQTGQHPGALKDAVCSPGGTTIAGVAELEKRGFRGTVMAAEHAAAEKSREMSR